MRPDGSLPSYDSLFGDLDFRSADESRSVYSPAAYLADLLQLAKDCAASDDTPGGGRSLDERRPDLAGVSLDGANSYTELPYLDIVNEVLGKRIAGSGDAFAHLTTLSYPFIAPFSLGHERLRQLLRQVGVDPVELYRRFAPDPAPDVVAREYLGLTPGDVKMVTTVLTDVTGLRDCYHLDDTDDAFTRLAAVDQFCHAAGLTGAELRELLGVLVIHRGGPVVSLDEDEERLAAGAEPVPVAWFDRVNRFVRLARRTAMSFVDLDLVLRTCCEGRIDLVGLRHLAVVRYLQRALDLPIDVVVSLVSKMESTGDLAGTGDILTAANAEYRRRVAAALGLAEPDLTAIVVRYRDRRVGPLFNGAGTGLEELSLLHRISRLAAALGISVTDLFGVLDALASDPSIQRFSTFPILIHTGVGGTDYDRILAGGDVAASLWLLQTLIAVVRWMQATGIAAAELAGILGTGPADGEADRAVLDSIGEQFAAVEPNADAFRSGRFAERAAQVIHDVVAEAAGGESGLSGRLLRVAPDRVTATAHAALAELGVVASNDFLGLDLAGRLVTKIYTNLMFAGYLAAGGTVVPDRIPESADELKLSGDFGAHREALFTLIAELCAASDTPSLYPSDMDGLMETRTAELYDNLIFNGYIGAGGEILLPDFFAEPGNVTAFAVNADLGDVAEDVQAVLVDRLIRFAADRPTLDPAIFAALPIGDQQRVSVVDSLRFNGHIDAEDRYVDPVALIDLPLADLRLGVEFHPYRRRVLDAMRDQLVQARAAAYTVTPDDLRDLADDAVARRIADLLADGHLRDGRLTDEAVALLAAPAATLALPGFSEAENATIAYQLGIVLDDSRPYRLDLADLAELGFTADERRRLVAQLIDAGHLDENLAVPADRLEYFGYAPNAADFALPGLADFSTDIFFLLHAVATELAAGIADITDALAGLRDEQRAVLLGTLRDAFGVPEGTAEAICDAVAGGGDRAIDLLVEPVLDDPVAAAADPDLRRALRRMRGFARFAEKLTLHADDVAAAFLDQDLAGKFPEPLALPAGADRIDALLDSADGKVYLFHGADVWVYSGATHELVERRPRSLAALSPALAAITTVDSAFTDAAGAEWIVGRDDDGAPHTFVREPGHPRWLRRTHQWGVVANAFDDPARIDAAFVDGGGRTYLFHRDQYVRYSGDDHTTVDEGYPRRIGGWWETERRTTPLPARFREALDAAFHGRDDTTYLFAGDSFLAVRDGAVAEPIAGAWGRIANTLAGASQVDAAYVDGPALYVFAGNQVTRYSASIESGAVVADEGYPRRIEAELGDVPAEFEGGVEAAFVDGSGYTHLFKDGRTVALRNGTTSSGLTAQRWGRPHPALPSGRVDAALVGLDGRTYIFSGDTYLRYSGADYSIVDVGYPRRIADDWDGLRRVDAAFVADGATHLFGAAGPLFDVSLDASLEASLDPEIGELDAGRLPWSLRQRLQAHGITVADDAAVTGANPQWSVTAERGVVIALRLVGARLEVSCAPETSVAFHVRYSTKDYAAADPGYPRPLSDNWWNLPEELVSADAPFARLDAVFTGRDNRTYLFSGGQFIVYDNKRRWWSEPRTLDDHWDSLPFDGVDAGFVGSDGRTYMFYRDQYVRYSTTDYTRADDRYPATITPFWGNVVNNIARTGRVDAALVTGEHTYLFSGDQFVRYTRITSENPYPEDQGLVDIGYPRKLSALAQEPRLRNLRTTVDSVSAAFADRATVYLFSGDRCHAVSGAAHRRYDDLAADAVGCAFVEDGAVCVEHPDGWYRYSALEGTELDHQRVRPRLLRPLPPASRTGVDAVLRGTDGNTYLFRGTTCVNADLGREYPLAEEWGRGRNAVYHDNAVDAAFVGADGRTYVFRDDQFVTYTGDGYLDVEVDGGPRPIAEHWGGLHRVALAYVRGGVTYLFEPPGPDGTTRYVAYSGANYMWPDEGYPRTADATFWEVPDEHRPDGFTMPRAVLSSGNSTLLLIDGAYLQYNDAIRTWSYPRPLDQIWRGIGPVDKLTTAFTGRDGATYFFFGTGEFVRHDGRSAAAREQIRARWACTRNNFLAGTGEDIVDAAVVHRGVTYLFAGDQYVRYSGPDYRYVDPGYPKPIVGNIRSEKAFAALPAGVEDDLAERYAAGSRSMVDAAVADDRTVFLFVGRTCHAVSTDLTAGYGIDILGRVRNNIADRGRVDAVLVAGEHTYLFSGDQYVRYTGGDYTRVDDGYPRTIAAGLPRELDVDALPDEFGDGIDAAFRAGDGTTYLFAGRDYARVANRAVTVAEVRGVWGVVHNEFRAERAGLDAAFVTRTGELYAFAGGQYVRYAPGKLATVEDGYPRRIRDDWGDLPATFERGIDGAFRFAGRTYLALGEEYVRYSGDRFDAIDRTYPQPFRYRWSAGAEYRLSDLRTIARFAELARNHRDADGGLATFVLPGRRIVTDPYAHLAELFGWDPAEVAWCRRNGRLLTAVSAPDGDRLELEFLLELVDLFALTERLGTGPSRAYADIWTRIHSGNPHGAADALYGLLERRTGPEQWPALARQLHDELNLRKRDALVATVLADGGTSRDLFERFLIDVDMGARGNTSRVREAIAAAQLYVHRYLLNLESPAGDEEARQRVKAWWQWMRNYRVWEANRKVFLYPENYLRPELRDTRTPAFRTLESDLLQGEITGAAVERAYKRYLDEYTEVSRLAIAGGYVYTKDQQPDGVRRLVLFGRTRTDPRRYYYRRAEFASREKMSATWEPWQPVDVRIDADQVHPVHAFGRVFVFWTVPETVANDDPAGTTVVARSDGDQQHVSGQGPTQRIRIYYSFYNLNKEWAPAQTLGTGKAETGTVSDATLLIRPRMKTDDQMSVVVSCSYTVTTPPEPGATGDAAKPTTRRAAALFELNPELYSENLLAASDAVTAGQAELLAVATDLEAASDRAATAERVARIFVDPVDTANVVRFDAASDTEFWFSADHKGGSFLCRPVIVTGTEGTRLSLPSNKDRIPESLRVDAAVELPNGNRYFFDNGEKQYLMTKPRTKLGEPESTAPVWGKVRTVLAGPGDVDAVIVRGNETFVLSGLHYVKFTGTPFGEIDPDYPKELDGNNDDLPYWRVDVAFTGPDDVEYYFDNGGDRYVTSKNLRDERRIADFWERPGVPDGFTTIDAAVVTDGATFLISGDWYVRFTHPSKPPSSKRPPSRPSSRRGRRSTAAVVNPFVATDTDHPLSLADNEDDLPTDFPIAAAVLRNGIMYWFDNSRKEYHEVAEDGTWTTRPTYAPPSALATTGEVHIAWLAGDRLYLTTGEQYVRYTLVDNAVPRFVDDGYPVDLPRKIDAAFTRDDDVYLFSGDGYVRIDADSEPVDLPDPLPIAGAWGELPRDKAVPFDAALDSESGLYLFVHDSEEYDYVRYSKTITVRRPYELAGLPFDIIRLTTGTASALNQKLLSGGVPALLDLAAQETDEVVVTTDKDATTAIRVRRGMVDAGRLPTGSHLDFRSANGLYYWEIFFHAPFLIAQALNGAQRFEDARRWYEYIFDPTNPDSYWRFLPFLAIDLDALAEALTGDLAELDGVGLPEDAVDAVQTALEPVIADLRTLAPAVAQNRDPATEEERAAELALVAPKAHEDVATALDALAEPTDLTLAQRNAIAGLRERTLMAADLAKQFDALGDRENLLKAYLDDPFDPHAIADLRPVAYRRAVVMRYVDNLLDWGDMLFRQYTGESVDEARMLYVLAYDLLGARPERLGTRLLPPAPTYADLDLIGYFTGGGTLITGPGDVNAGITNEYFHIPENSVFDEYWARVEDRLHKIRQSLNIMGISQPLPLFEPPLDPMALVRSVAAGGQPDQLTAGAAVPVPHYRFPVVFRRAQELADKLRQLGADLLSVLERGSAEELSLLQRRQEQEILTMTRAIRAAQIRAAEESLAELTASRDAAQDRVSHYKTLIATGMTEKERAQVGLMSTAASLHFASSVLKVAAGIAHAVPEFHLGPFIVGTTSSGRQLGDSIDKAAETGESLGEGFSMAGEVLGIQAQHDRMVEDWNLQLATAQSDVTQLEHRVTAATQQVAIARREADVLEREIAHNESIATFLKDKFTNAELYTWMSGTLAGLYFQAYNLAYETARAAERAFQFEHGLTAGEAATFIRPGYWQNRRGGLLAGESLGMDLERLGKAHFDTGGRGLEITRQVSLRELDPIALLRLRDAGSCEFALTEALFAHDFPGHYRRQIRTVTVTFYDADGEPFAVPATLTQLGHKTVLEPDPQAVRHLLDPQGAPPATVRSDWRASQQIALSDPDGGRENNGLFELRFDDERYLPFEGTGAVSRWSLSRGGRLSRELADVLVTVKYTAEQGGEVFANAVRGLLKPYPAARFFDVARDFPEEWNEFLAGDDRLALPFTAEMFPDLAGQQISGIYPTYDLANGAVTRLVLGGDPAQSLSDGKLLPTPGLTLRPTAWTFTVDGPKENLRNVGLVLTYQARVQ